MTKNELLELCKQLESNDNRLIISSKDGAVYWTIHTYVLEGPMSHIVVIGKYSCELKDGLLTNKTDHWDQIPYIIRNEVSEKKVGEALEVLEKLEDLIQSQPTDIETIKNDGAEEVRYIDKYLLPKLKQNKNN